MSQITVAAAATVIAATMTAGSALLTASTPTFNPNFVADRVTITNAGPGTISGADGTINIAQFVLTSASNPFNAGMVGKYIKVPGAGPSGGDLTTTIAVFTNAGSITLTNAAQASVTTAVVTVFDATLSTNVFSYQSSTQVTLVAAPSVPVNLPLQVITFVWAGSATCDSSSYPFIVFSSPLTGGDTVIVAVLLPDGQTTAVAMDINGVNTGLSATNPSRTYFGGPTYLLTKGGIASSVGAYADLGSRRI